MALTVMRFVSALIGYMVGHGLFGLPVLGAMLVSAVFLFAGPPLFLLAGMKVSRFFIERSPEGRAAMAVHDADQTAAKNELEKARLLAESGKPPDANAVAKAKEVLYGETRPVPPEVAACLEEVEKVELLLEAACFPLPRELMQGVRQQLSDYDRAVHTVQVDHVSPRNLAWLLASNVAGDLVACGQFHVYRGLLSSGGQALTKAFHRAVDELVQGGFHDAAAAEKDRQWLKQRIEEAG